jgi:hypothetical protein
MAVQNSITGIITNESICIPCSPPFSCADKIEQDPYKYMVLKKGPNYVGTSAASKYAQRIKATPGTYTFASKKWPYAKHSQNTMLSAGGAVYVQHLNLPKNQVADMNRYESIGKNVAGKADCFTGECVPIFNFALSNTRNPRVFDGYQPYTNRFNKVFYIRY